VNQIRRFSGSTSILLSVHYWRFFSFFSSFPAFSVELRWEETWLHLAAVIWALLRLHCSGFLDRGTRFLFFCSDEMEGRFIFFFSPHRLCDLIVWYRSSFARSLSPLFWVVCPVSSFMSDLYPFVPPRSLVTLCLVLYRAHGFPPPFFVCFCFPLIS